VRRVVTLRIVIAMSVAITLSCLIWSVVAQNLVPDACSYNPPPPNAQYLHCP